MAWLPIAQTTPQYVDASGDPYSGAVLKFYANGTSTNINLATDNTGGTTATSVALNASGYPEVSGSVIIPHLQQAYKVALYATQAAADADSGALWTVDNITPPVTSQSSNNNLTSVSSNDTTPGYLNGKLVGGRNVVLAENSDGGDETLSVHGWTKGSDVASATALPLIAGGNYVDVTGTTTVTSIDTLGAGSLVKLHFDGALTLTHHATNLILPGGTDITTAAGDEAELFEYATGDWRLTNYLTATGSASGGKVVQLVHVQDGTATTGTTLFPVADATPDNADGDEYMTLAITPKSTANILVIEVTIHLAHTSASRWICSGLFQDSTVDALASAVEADSVANAGSQQTILHKMAAGTTSATTFKVRGGSDTAGTTTFNGSGGTQQHNGFLCSSILITEYTP